MFCNFVISAVCAVLAHGVAPRAVQPTWSDVPPKRTVVHAYDTAESAAANGDGLLAALGRLEPGDRMEVEGGRYELRRRFELGARGTLSEPIWIVARNEAEAPHLVRSDARQNVVDVATTAGSRAAFVCLRGFEVSGGSIGIRLGACSDVWVDECYVHDTGEAGITANSANTARLYLTRNEVHSTGGYGEGLYLGANDGKWTMRDSVVAWNHVHDTGGTQGDGIEVKQGSSGNWIAYNRVHDTGYPCLLVYGTGGGAPNVIEGNVLYSSAHAVLQVQGEAIVRNNLMIDGALGFESRDHQGSARDLVFVHNTVINAGPAVDLRDWSDRAGMVFANNAICSRVQALRVHGARGVRFTGNVVSGEVRGVERGFVEGDGLSDFVQVRWDATLRDARPSPTSRLRGAGDPTFATHVDRLGRGRAQPPSAGCYAGP